MDLNDDNNPMGLMLSNMARQFRDVSPETPDERADRLDALAAKSDLSRYQLDRIDATLHGLGRHARDSHVDRLQQSQHMVPRVVGECIESDPLMDKVMSSLLTDPETFARFVFYIHEILEHESVFDDLDLDPVDGQELVDRFSVE